MMRKLIAGAILLAAAPAPAEPVVLPGHSEIWLVANEEVNSSSAQTGTRFRLSVSRDVIVDGHVVVPAGSPAFAQVSYRTGKGAYGRSGKLEFDLMSVEIAGRQVPLSGHYRVEGQGNTGATIGAVVAAGLVAGAFVTGHAAIVRTGSEYRGFTLERYVAAATPLAPRPLQVAEMAGGDARAAAIAHEGPRPAVDRTPVVDPGKGRRNGRDDTIEVIM